MLVQDVGVSILARTRCLRKERCQMKECKWRFSLLSLVAATIIAATGALPVLGEPPKVEFEITEGRALIHIPGVTPDAIEDIFWGGNSIVELLNSNDSIKSASDGIVFSLPVDFRFEGAGVLEIHLYSGDILVRGIPDDSVLQWRAIHGDITKAICASTSLYSRRSCGGTVSAYDVPYRCCDNNYDGDASDRGDGNCVWLAWVKAREHGWLVPVSWGNATDWCDEASHAPGWSVSTTPEVDTIACSKSIGHVAWVTNVDAAAKRFTVTEQNCKVEPSCFGSGTILDAISNCA